MSVGISLSSKATRELEELEGLIDGLTSEVREGFKSEIGSLEMSCLAGRMLMKSEVDRSAMALIAAVAIVRLAELAE